MKKLGFIDYYLNEWHADNYPDMITKATDGKYQVCYAYAYSEPPIEKGLLSNKEWAKLHRIELLDSIEEVIEKSDSLIVLSPDNPEMHEILCDLPLKSGKPTYIDKTFAPDKETAIRIFDKANKGQTKCFSSSALRFSAELQDIDRDNIYKIYSEGPSSLEVYSIHQIEPVMKLMNRRATRLMFLGDRVHPSMIIEFEDGRYAQIYHRNDKEGSFRITTVDVDNNAMHYEIKSDFFGLFIKAMIGFFETGIVPVPQEQTISVIAVRAAALKACETPFEWICL
jgi:hypothetical protein